VPRFSVGLSLLLALACSRAPVTGEEAPQPGPERSKPALRVRASGQLGPGRGTLVVDIRPPSGGKLRSGGPLVVRAAGEHLHFPASLRTRLDPAELPVKLPVVVEDGAWGPAVVELSYYHCGDGGAGACRHEQASLIVDLDLTGPGAGGEAYLVHQPESG
jgi:hypothetical protein